MKIKHDLIVHLIDVVSRQNQYIVRIEALHICEILVDCVSRSGIPFRFSYLLIGRKDGNASHVPVEVPGDADSNVGLQTMRRVLSQYTHGVNTGIDLVAEGKINNPVLSAERNCRFCNLCCQNTQS